MRRSKQTANLRSLYSLVLFAVVCSLHKKTKQVTTMFTIEDFRPHENDVSQIKGLDFRLYIEEDEEGVPRAVGKYLCRCSLLRIPMKECCW